MENLNKKKYILTFADYNTGIVLDNSFNVKLADNQIDYINFETFDEALNRAREIVGSNTTIECYIHNSEGELILKLDTEGEHNFPLE